MKIAIVDGDDWKGLYLDGKLVMENHTLTIYDLLDALNIEYKYLPVDENWLGEMGTLPEKLSEVKEELP